MNTHKHARLTFARRLEMAKQRTLQGLDAVRAAAAHGVTAPTARKWLGRYLAGGEAALADASFTPMRSPRTIDAGKGLLSGDASWIRAGRRLSRARNKGAPV